MSMSTKRVLTAELVGPALDWAVALCEGHRPPLLRVLRGNVALPDQDDPMVCDYLGYSTDWDLGGPILHREMIDLKSEANDGSVWSAQLARCRQVLRGAPGDLRLVFSYCMQRGPTPLIAAMRCRVTIKLGDYVAVPAELLE